MDKKKLASVIIAKKLPEKEKDKEYSDAEFYHLAKKDAASRMLKAIKDEDHSMLAMAMEDFMRVCEEYSEEME